jgi:uncharacterized protein YukJ
MRKIYLKVTEAIAVRQSDGSPLRFKRWLSVLTAIVSLRYIKDDIGNRLIDCKLLPANIHPA